MRENIVVDIDDKINKYKDKINDFINMNERMWEDREAINNVQPLL